METTAINSTDNVVQPPSATSKSESDISEKSTLNNGSDSAIPGLELNKQETTAGKDVSDIPNSAPINLNTCHETDSETFFSPFYIPNASKSLRNKTSDKLTKVIETCKKLQNANKMKNDAVVPDIPPAVVPKPVELNGKASQNSSTSVPELSVSVSRLTPTQGLLSDHVENESHLSSSSNNSLSLSHSVSESSNSNLQNTSESTLKRFLFLFRPSDHEVLVRNKGVNMYRCNVCGGMYRQKFSLKRHFLRTHINFQYISKSDISNCKIAVPNEFIPQDDEPGSEKAPLNKKKFKSSNAIFFENNEARVMPGLYTCHICTGVKFDIEHELREHYNTHSDAVRKRFQCDKCGASFFKKQILSRHLASHGEKVVKKECRRCGSEFASKAEYQKHMISHSSGRVCKYCSKILSTSANRKRHEALHLGLKPYRCTHCGMCFAQSKDLDRHLRKQHSDVCHFCDICNKLFPSQASLDLHLHEKHSDHSPKKVENSSSPEQLVTISNAKKPEPIKVTVPIKLKVCIVCKRSFPTFYAMMKHRTQAHPYHTRRRRNRKTLKQKIAQQAAAQDALANRKAYGKTKHNATFPTSSVRRGRPPLDRTVKFGTPSYRPGSRWTTKREKELAKREEMEFYCSLSDKIAENLLHYVDGKTSQLSLKAYNSSNQHYSSGNFEERGRFPWSNYNFPAGYDVEMALKTRGCEVKNPLPENLSNRDKCLYATGLNNVQKLSQMGKGVVNIHTNLNTSISETVRIQVNGIDMKMLNLEERRKMIGKTVSVVCICHICKEKFESSEAFKEHCVNNHPNVDCCCIELEGNKDELPEIPADLCRQSISADGVFFSWNVPPPLSEASLLKCTKCKSDFKTYFELHSHIVKCGNLRSSPTHVWKIRRQKRIKRTMKNRMNLSDQRSAFDSYIKTFKTPEKSFFEGNESSTKSNEKTAKSSEKSQFYKSGRLQTTSFTVDMNYFKTKPVKPPNTQPSKRGRKSYATLSYRYKNASMQSTSIQCSHCKETFSSQSSLNIHLQSHMLSQSTRNEKTFIPSPSAKSANCDAPVMHSKSTDAVSSVHPVAAETVNLSLDKSKVLQNHDKSISSKSPLTHENLTKLSLPFISNRNISQAQKPENKSITSHENTKSLSHSTPLDLSRNFNATNLNKNSAKLGSNENTPTKSALEIAMTAIQEYSQTLEHDEHISKLQKTVEKITPPSKSIFSDTKSLSAKKVGRPKKVKRLSPVRFKKNLFPETVENKVVPVSKPLSKLEETVKRLFESKAKPDTSHTKETVSPLKSVQTNLSTKLLDTHVSPVHSIQPTSTPEKHGNKKADSLPASPSFNSTTNVTSGSTSNFVPILIYTNPNKPVNVLRVTASPKTSNASLNPIVTKTVTESINVNKHFVNADNSKPSPVSEKTAENEGDINTSVTSLNPPEKRNDETNHPSSSQGRISPSLESIVNSIKQKLHSQESSPHDDVAISWLEDEKFEIPSIPKLNLPAPSNSNSPVPISSESSVPAVPDSAVLINHEIQVSIITPDKPQSSSLNALETNPDIVQKVESLHKAEITLDDPKSKSLPNRDEFICSTDKPANDEVKLLPVNRVVEMERNDLSNEIASHFNLVTENKPKVIRKIRKYKKKKYELFTARKKRKAEKKIEIPHKKGTGRPHKSASNTDVTEPDVTKNLDSCNVDHPIMEMKDSISDQISSPSLMLNENSELKVESNIDTTEQSICMNVSNNVNEIRKSPSKQSINLKLTALTKPTNNESTQLSCATTTKLSNLQLNDAIPAIKASHFQTPETKQSDPITNLLPTVETSITTEFGKSLASRMKEKMRQSFESLIRSDECNNTDKIPEPPFSDTNSLISDDDSEYLAIKKEMECLEPTKKHSCPFCMLEFAYLTNFRRHLRVCRSRILCRAIEPVPSTSAPVLQFLPKKDEVEHSMLNLLRHQSRQTQMLKEAEKTTGSKVDNKFRTYSCNVCHRIYLSLFKLLQHQVTHKLNTLEQNADLDYTKDIEHFSVSDLEERSFQDSEISKDIGQNCSSFNLPVETENSSKGEKLCIPRTGEEKDDLFLNPASLKEIVSSKLSKEDSPLLREINKTDEEIAESNVSTPPVILNSGTEDVAIQDQTIKDDTTVEKHENESKSTDIKKEPMKRKRGRPVGWRKNLNNVIKKAVSKFQNRIKTQSVSLDIKKKINNADAVNLKHTNKFLNKSVSRLIKPKSCRKYKNLSLKQFEFTPDDDLPPCPTPLKEIVASKLYKKDSTVNPLTSLSKEKTKKVFKTSLKKKFRTSGDTLEDRKSVLPKLSQNSTLLIMKQTKESVNKEMKRPRGRPISLKVEESVSTAESTLPVKRKPGRPKRVFQAIPSTSKSKGYSQSLTSRNFRKMISRSVVVDRSSDSDDDDNEETESDVKKKIMHLKPCPICKEKFSATLILHRHIQLVHNRPSNQKVKVEDLETPKASRKLNVKSSVSSSGDDFITMKSSKAETNSDSEASEQLKPLDSPSLPEPLITNNTNRKNSKFCTTFKNNHNISKKPSADFCDNDISNVTSSNSCKSITKSKSTDQPAEADIVIDSEDKIEIKTMSGGKKHVKKLAKAVIDDNVDTVNPNTFDKKDFSLKTINRNKFGKCTKQSIPDSTSDTDNFVHIATKNKKLVPKSSARNLATKNAKTRQVMTNTKMRRSSKRPAFSAADDSSDVDSIKSLNKTVPDFHSSNPRILKRVRTGSNIECNSDSDSVKNFRESSQLSICRTANYNSSDSESVKSFVKGTGRLRSSWSSGNDSRKKTRSSVSKIIAIDVSDGDSDISIIADITPVKYSHVCPVCNVNFTRAFHLQRHIRLEHSSDSSSSSVKTNVTLPKHLRICPICKNKFATKPALCQHMQNMHSRKSYPNFVKSSQTQLVKKSTKSTLLKIEDDDANRSALSRQCRKPLPPLKRKWSKKDLSS